jgi:hypothetical protein
VLHRGASSLLSHLFINLCYTKGHVPPCYQSQLIINLRCLHENLLAIIHISSSICVFERGVPPCYHSHLSSRCVTRRARPVLSFTTHHQFVFHEGARPSVLSFTTHHQVVFSRGASLRAIIHNSSSFVFYEGVLRAIIHNSSSCCFHEGTSSVLSFTTVHQICVFTRARPPYHSQLFIMLCFHEGARPSV